jgi:mono/diheme cytochrome c family protein
MNRRAVIIAGLFLCCWFQSCKEGNDMPATVTFAEHVAPVLYANCAICHRPGGSAHFSLVGYNEARKYAGANAYVSRQRIMPPWPADPHYTQFVGQRVLSERDILLLEKWVKDGTPMGPQDKLPALPQYPVGSDVGTPDMRIAVQPYVLSANSADRFLLVKVPYELPADTFASLIEYIPGHANIVHHVNGDMVKYDAARKTNVFEGDRIIEMAGDTATLKQAYQRLGLPNDDGSYPVLQKSVVNYLPGVYGQRYPDGIGGYRLPRKGAFLLNDLHYGFNNKALAVTDSSYINIFFSPVPPNRPVQEFQLGTWGVVPAEPDMQILPNTIKPVYSRFTVPFDISILTINPHMHLLGKSFKAYALQPGGDTIRLISIPRWDFNWQYFYTFKKMVKVPKGSTIVAEGIYDNTTANLNNPFSPPRLVTDQNGSMKATDEMFQFIITYLPYQPGDEQFSLERR